MTNALSVAEIGHYALALALMLVQSSATVMKRSADIPSPVTVISAC